MLSDFLLINHEYTTLKLLLTSWTYDNESRMKTKTDAEGYTMTMLGNSDR
jgi:hypothetical protein